MFLSKLKEEKTREAKKFGISPDHTACNFMMEFIEADRQSKQADALAYKVGAGMGMNPCEQDAYVASVRETANELNLAPDISKLDRKENRLFALAEEGAKMLDNLTVGIEENLSLSKSGFAEARILCSTIVTNIQPELKNEIDMDDMMDRYSLLLCDATLFDCDNTEDLFGYINSRIRFYREQITEMKAMSGLQVFQPNNAIAKIFNAIYRHPECENPSIIIASEISPNDVIMFRGQLEKVINHLQWQRAQIDGCSESQSQGFFLQSEIESTLMLLFPESRRSEINQDVVALMSDVMLENLRKGELKAEISSKLPMPLRQKFTQLAVKIKEYSSTHDDIDSMIESAQNNVINKFSN